MNDKFKWPIFCPEAIKAEEVEISNKIKQELICNIECKKFLINSRIKEIRKESKNLKKESKNLKKESKRLKKSKASFFNSNCRCFTIHWPPTDDAGSR